VARDARSRSVVKSVTFRVIVVISDLVVIFLITHRVDQTIVLTILTNIASTVLYYLHERAWNLVDWGRISDRRTK
jgi:uncharacterized membrane protein